MSDDPLFLQTPDDVARIYGDRLYLIDGLPEEDESETETAEPKTLLSGLTQAENSDAIPAAEEGKREDPAKTEDLTPVKEAKKPSYDKPGIDWRPKDNSQVLFILHQSELKNKTLTELLKQIVLSIGIPFESAGFGIVKGPVSEMEFQDMPNPYGIVFDPELLPGDKNPMPTVDGFIVFTERLKDLQHDKDAKRALWNHLKTIKNNL